MAKNTWGDWWEIYIRDKCTCVYCGYTGHSLFTWRQFEVDHLIPKHLGGTEALMNKVLACRYCNNLKGKYDPAGGAFIGPSSEFQRNMLIQKARDYIVKRVDEIYGSEGEELRDFQLMMSELGKTIPCRSGIRESGDA